jgi:tetratricopeptide (TPR) repeat protein
MPGWFRSSSAIAAMVAMLLLTHVTAAAAHGGSHGGGMPYRAPLVDHAGEVIPAHLIAAVCGMPGREGDAGFERRLDIARYLLAQAGEAPPAQAAPPLLSGLGDYHREADTDDVLAQRYFDQGMVLTFAFNHPEALLAFREARRRDPACAMCWWGEAYVLGPNINASMDPQAMTPARHAIGEARAAVGDDALEQGLIEALALRYAEGGEQASRNGAYALAMAELAGRFADDVDVLALYADALMNISPWDYWQADGVTLRPGLARLVPVLEQALALDGEHAYAIHLYIHAVEASRRPEVAEKYADRLAALAPAAGHLVHMPSHLYVRVGRWQDAIAANRDAVEADEVYLEQTGRDSPYRYTYYPHNVHFLLESARMSGDGATAMDAANKLTSLTSLEMSLALPWVQLIDAAPYFAHAQFAAPERTLALAQPAGELPYVLGAWHYARGVAMVAQGQFDAAAQQVRAMRMLADQVDWAEAMPGVPADVLLHLASEVLEGRMYRAQGDVTAAVAAYGHAVSLQDGLPYLEPPMWYYPIRQSLGAALLEADRADEAIAVFRQGLENNPNQAWLLYGLHIALASAGQAQEAIAARRRFEAVWLGRPGGPVLADL